MKVRPFFKDWLSDPDFLISERDCDADFRPINESQFTIGNGYVGSRGIYEEIPSDTRPGTFFAGIFDSSMSKVSELVNAPNPFDIRIVAPKGEKLGVSAMTVLSNQRILDMRQGLLARHTVYENHAGKKYDYQSLRFISMNNLNVAVMQVSLTPLDEVTNFTINSIIDTSVVNCGTVTEGEKRHFRIHEVEKRDLVYYIAVRTLQYETIISYASKLFISHQGKTKPCSQEKMGIRCRKGERILLTKYIVFFTSREVVRSRIKNHTIKVLAKIVALGSEKLRSKHSSAFKERWDTADVMIDSDIDSQVALRFCIYHLIIAAHAKVKDVNIPARTLSGAGYRGHAFWDTEIFALPFFTFSDPNIARNLLEYRSNRLVAAKEIASAKNFRGAMFPWESADTGADETPAWAKNFDGKIIKIYTNEQEQHISADVLYGVCSYFAASNDVEFMLKSGLSVAIEIARFWHSRVEPNKNHSQYSISGIIGPDEFHEKVKNNAFTNMMAAWCLNTAARLVDSFLKSHPKQLKSILATTKLKKKECVDWKTVARKIKVPVDKKRNVIAQFDGFFRLKSLPQPPLDEYGMPGFPQKIPVGELGKTQFIKQADIVMLMHLLPHLFTRQQALDNYHLYEPLSLHKSSLSAPVHSVVASNLGLRERAFHYFQISANTDRNNIYGNTAEGIHAAVLGGTWQAVIFGFCGIRITKSILGINPSIPATWQKIKTKLIYKEMIVHITAKQDEITIYLEPLKSKAKQTYKKLHLPVRAFGELHELVSHKEYRFERRPEHKLSHYEMEGLL